MIRAKFRVHYVDTHKDNDGNVQVEIVNMSPVYSPDKESENYKWSQATPAGQLQMVISNPAAHGKFETNKEYYLDFTPVE